MPEVWEALVTGDGYRSGAKAASKQREGPATHVAVMHEDDVTEWKTDVHTMRDPTREELAAWLAANGSHPRDPRAPVLLAPPAIEFSFDDDCPI